MADHQLACSQAFTNTAGEKNRTIRDAIETLAWIRDIAYNLNNDLINDFKNLWNAIQSAQLNLEDNVEDEITWILESLGQYSASSAYDIQFADQIASNFSKLIWETWAPRRCKFFLWLLLQNKIWTAARLQLRDWKNNYFYALCKRSLKQLHGMPLLKGSLVPRCNLVRQPKFTSFAME